MIFILYDDILTFSYLVLFLEVVLAVVHFCCQTFDPD